MKKFVCSISVSVVIIMALIPTLASANVWTVLGYDGASIGRGGALTGGVKGPASVYYNPAGLARLTRTRTTVSYLHGEPLLELSSSENPELLDFSAFSPFADDKINTACGTLESTDGCVREFRRYNSYLKRGQTVSNAYAAANKNLLKRAKEPRRLDGVVAGFSSPLTIFSNGNMIAVGGSLFLPGSDILYQRLKGPTSPYFLQYDDAPQRVVIDLAAAASYGKLRVGAGFEVLIDLNTAMDANALLPAELRIGSVVAPDPNFGDVALLLDGEVKAQLKLIPNAGIQYSPGAGFDLGVSFRDQQQVNISADVQMLLDTPFGRESIPVSIQTQARFQPRELSAGASWTHGRVQLFADVRWKQWSNYRPEIAVKTKISSLKISGAACQLVQSIADFQEILDLAGGVVNLSNEDICPLIEGQIQELGLEDISLYDVKDNALNDTFNPSFGISVSAASLTASLGYRYEPNPLPRQTGVFNIIDADTHVIGSSLEWAVFDFATVGIFGQYRLLEPYTTIKDRDKILEQSANADPYPDLDSDPANGPSAAFSVDNEPFRALTKKINDVQVLNSGYPAYKTGGGYLSAGLQLTVDVDGLKEYLW